MLEYTRTHVRGGILMEQKLYSTYEVGKLLRVHEVTVRRWCRQRKIEFISKSASNHKYITESALKRFVRMNPKYDYGNVIKQ